MRAGLGALAAATGAAVLLGAGALHARSQDPVAAPAPAEREVNLRVYVCEAGAPPPEASCKPTYGTPERPTAYACAADLKVSAPQCEMQPVLDPVEGLGAGGLDGDGGLMGVDCPGDTRCP